jgi:hypothetical protein
MMLQLFSRGIKFIEVKAPHLAREKGKSKYYSLGRYVKTLTDMFLFRLRWRRMAAEFKR